VDTLQGADGFHYVLSKAQEEDIRECFLTEKLRNYTQVRKEVCRHGSNLGQRGWINGRLRECLFLLD
jgi:hypothetical protein